MSDKEVISLAEVQKYFREALFETVSTMAGMEIGEKNIEMDRFDIAAAMILHGKKNALLSISTKREYAAVLVAYMTGTDFDSIKDEELADVICELVNMTAGLVKVRLSHTDSSFMLSSPFSITGEDIKLAAKSYIESLAICAGSGDVDLKLELYYL